MVILQASLFRHIVLIALIAFISYGAVPGIGAFMVRARWRRFRSLVLKAAAAAIPGYGLLHGGQRGRLGFFRFYGALGALQEHGKVWIEHEALSLKVDLEGALVYMISATAQAVKEENGFPDPSMLVQVPWRRIHTMLEGTRFFVAGELFCQEEGPVFKTTRDTHLLVIVHDCPPGEVLTQALWNGRERNEYWNQFTPGALSAGSFILFLYFYLLLRSPMLRFPAVLALSATLLPLSPVLPPATPAYWFYRKMWRQARLLRAERDMLKLRSLLSGESLHHNAAAKEHRAVKLELVALFVLIISSVIELGILFALFSTIIR